MQLGEAGEALFIEETLVGAERGPTNARRRCSSPRIISPSLVISSHLIAIRFSILTTPWDCHLKQHPILSCPSSTVRRRSSTSNSILPALTNITNRRQPTPSTPPLRRPLPSTCSIRTPSCRPFITVVRNDDQRRRLARKTRSNSRAMTTTSSAVHGPTCSRTNVDHVLANVIQPTCCSREPARATAATSR